MKAWFAILVYIFSSLVAVTLKHNEVCNAFSQDVTFGTFCWCLRHKSTHLDITQSRGELDLMGSNSKSVGANTA